MTDENDVPESAEVLSRLEKIDDETNNMDITFVKMADARYARKWGVTKLPAIVYFRNKFPSVYRGKYETNLLNLNYFQLSENQLSGISCEGEITKMRSSLATRIKQGN